MPDLVGNDLKAGTFPFLCEIPPSAEADSAIFPRLKWQGICGFLADALNEGHGAWEDLPSRVPNGARAVTVELA